MVAIPKKDVYTKSLYGYRNNKGALISSVEEKKWSVLIELVSKELA